MKLLFTGKYLLFKTREKRCQPYLHLHFHSCSQENGLPSHLRGDISLSCQDQNKPSSKAASSPAARTLGLLFIMRLALILSHGTSWGCSRPREPLLYAWGFPAFWIGKPLLAPLLRLTLQYCLLSHSSFLLSQIRRGVPAQSIVCFLGTAFPIWILLFSAVFLVLYTVPGIHWSLDGHCQMSRHFLLVPGPRITVVDWNWASGFICKRVKSGLSASPRSVPFTSHQLIGAESVDRELLALQASN